MEGVSFLKCGPFPNFFHGVREDAPHGLDAKKSTLVGQCQLAICRADIFCAHISTADAFGTLVEIGLAHAMRGAPISLTLTEDIVERHRFDMGGGDYADHDLWFAEHLVASSPRSKAARVRNAAEARAFHGAFIRENTPREIRLVAGLAAGHGSAGIVFGDPFDIATGSGGALWSGYNLSRFARTNKHHAEVARAHRFDNRG
jgi:hypothetical protein